MKIRAVANGNVIEAHPDAARQLIEAGIYEEVSEEQPQSSENLSPENGVVAAPKAAATKRKRRKA